MNVIIAMRYIKCKHDMTHSAFPEAIPSIFTSAKGTNSKMLIENLKGFGMYPISW